MKESLFSCLLAVRIMTFQEIFPIFSSFFKGNVHYFFILFLNTNFRKVVKKWSPKKVTFGLFVFYLLALAWIILLKFQFSFAVLDRIRNINLIPFRESVIANGRIDFREIILNGCILRQPTAAGAVPNGRRAVLTAD